MAWQRNFPRSPYEVLPPDLHWFPATQELRCTAYKKLLPPLVAKVREELKAWRNADYVGASATSHHLLSGSSRIIRASMDTSGCVTPGRFAPRPRGHVQPKKSVFNHIVGQANADSPELAFAAFLEDASDVQALSKNDMAVGFKIEYVNANVELSIYTPDFIVRTTDDLAWIAETKCQEEINPPQEMAHLRQWCLDATEASRTEGATQHSFVYVDQQSLEQRKPSSFTGLVSAFREYQEARS